jgi:hypothetical protein
MIGLSIRVRYADIGIKPWWEEEVTTVVVTLLSIWMGDVLNGR